MTIENIKTYLENKITGSWYANAKIDYDITGKFLNAEIIGNNLKIVWEEMGNVNGDYKDVYIGRANV